MKLGPIDVTLPGIFEIEVEPQGEWVRNVKLTSGFTHRRLEKRIEENRWHHSLLFVDRLSPDLPYFYEQLFCEAVEEISSIEVPPRARAIRNILVQLNALESELMYLARIARSLSLMPCFHFFMRDREKLLDLFELISGARGNPHFFRYGGVARDISDGFVERLVTIVKEFHFRLKEYDRVFFENPSVISILEEVVRDGESPLLHTRRQLEERLVHLIFLMDKIEGGDFFLFTYDDELCIPVGESIKSILTPRGMAHLHLRSNGTTRPEKASFFTPSQRIFRDSATKLRGIHVNHVAIALHLFGFQISEVDK